MVLFANHELGKKENASDKSQINRNAQNTRDHLYKLKNGVANPNGLGKTANPPERIQRSVCKDAAEDTAGIASNHLCSLIAISLLKRIRRLA